MKRALLPWALSGALLGSAGLSGCASISALWKDEPTASTANAGNVAASVRLVAEYELDVQAPSGLRALLEEHLDLARFRSAPEDQRLSRQELGRLIQAAPQQAQALLETEGYFNAKVSASRADAADAESRDPIRVTVSVEPGPRTVVRRVQMEFSGALAAEAAPSSAEAAASSTTASATASAEQAASAAVAASAPAAPTVAPMVAPDAELARSQARLRDRLQGAWALGPGTEFSQTAWSRAKSASLLTARSEGYPRADWADKTLRIDAEQNSAEIDLRLDSGPLFRLGELRIEGLKHQPRSAVERLAGFSPGTPYTERALQDFQDRLIKTTLFDGVSVDIRPDTEQPEAAPVWVLLREAPRQQLTASIGYDTGNGPRVGADYIHRRPFGLDLRSRSKLKLSRKDSSLDVELSSHPQPDLQRNIGALFIERLEDGGKVTVNLRTRLGRSREAENQDRSYYLELLRARETDPQGTISAGAASLNVQWLHRRVDSVLTPTRGYTASLLLGLGHADNSVAPNGAFARHHAKLQLFRPLPGQWFAVARTEWAQVHAQERTGLPEKLRFRAGGDDSVRGYGPEDLGPLDSDGNRVGGRILWTGSLELAHGIYPAMPPLLGAVFVDAGQAAMDWKTLKPKIGYGMGLRYRSPLGTLRLDFARPREDEGRWRLHFSVGIAL